MISRQEPCRPPHRAVAIPILFLFSAGLYANTIGNGFVFDDAHQILNNPWIRDFGHLHEIFTTHVWAFAGRDSNYYRPLMHVVFAALYVPFGPEAWVFHLANVLLHGLATVMVFLIVSRIVPDRSIVTPRFTHSAAFASGLIFAAHPIHTEAVAWISSLPDLACAAFYLMGVLMYLRSSTTGDRWTMPHGLGAVCYLASALFKEPGVTLPGVVVLLDLAMRPRGRNARFWATRYAFLAAAGGIYLVLRFVALGGFVPTASDQSAELSMILLHMGSAVWEYIAMLVAPVQLNAFHTFKSTAGIPATAILAVLPLLLGYSLWKRSLRWTAAIAMFLLPLIPALYAPALLPGLDNPWAERYVYLSSVGLVVGLGSVLDSIHGLRTGLWRIATVGLAVVLVVFSIATIRRNTVWRNDLTLWTDTVQKSPNSWAAHSYLGYALFSNGDIEGAIGQYRRAIAMRPDFADAHLNLGVALAVIGQHDAAVMAYDQALKLTPRSALTHANLSISLAALGHVENALDEAEQAVALDRLCAKAYSARGVALGNMGRIAEAVESFQRAIELDPVDANSMANLERAKRHLTNNN
jgi:tetratricopeptide (TPR) repeat protein